MTVAQAQSEKSPYSEMAPLDRYLIAGKDAEIALARSAAPTSISSEAEVMVLEKEKGAVKSPLLFYLVDAENQAS